MASGNEARDRNARIAERLRMAADLLAQQQANPYRVRAYRRAADTVEGLAEDVARFIERRGRDALPDLPGVGQAIAAAIEEMVSTGRWSQLDRLRGEVEPEQLFQSLPGVGPELARHIHDHLGIDSLEALEAAAHDGRLRQVPGIGERRAAMLRAELMNRLSRAGVHQRPGREEPTIAVLLHVDQAYREAAEAGTLPTIAPRRFNPEGEAWLPVLHTQRGGWQLTALYSNTARAHDLGRVGDWVVIYFHSDARPEGQRTVVTESRGPLANRRVVRGREAECRAYYAERPGSEPHSLPGR